MNSIDICNLALANIGSTRPISQFADGTPEAVVCNRYYDTCRQSLLLEFPWGFAVRSFVPLVLVADEKDPRYDFVYEYPSDALRVMAVGNGDKCEPRNDFEIIHTRSDNSHVRRIVTDVADARAEYIADLDVAEVFPPLFVKALAWELSAAIAIALAKDAKVAQYAYQMAAEALANAKHKAALERHKPVERKSSWLAARR